MGNDAGLVKILVSNDDGIHAPGLKALVKHLRGFADVTVVAPDREQSASSHSLTLHRPLRIHRLKAKHYAIDGTPTDCILLAVHQILKEPPDLVVSGINRGANLGDDVHYSGTVSAAMEGTLLGLPSIAVSLASFGDKKLYFNTAAHFAETIIKKVLRKALPKGVLLNVNVPNLPVEDVKGINVCQLGKRNYGGVIIEKVDPRGRNYYWIGGDQEAFFETKDTDCAAIQQQQVSVTPVRTDLNHRKFYKDMESWRFR